jgi:hypothetical protein
MEKRFIRKMLTECKKITDDITVMHGTHLMNGDDEDLPFITDVCNEFEVNRATVAWTNFIPARTYHNSFRWYGLKESGTQHDMVLFLDADEIIDGDLFVQWWKANSRMLSQYPAYAFEAYWYFREPIYRATTTEHAGLLIHKKEITEQNIYNDMQRWGIAPLKPHVMAPGGIPMIHHYSWVRTKEEMIIKIRNWGDKHVTLACGKAAMGCISDVHESFETPIDENFRDFVHGYSFTTVSNFMEEVDAIQK